MAWTDRLKQLLRPYRDFLMVVACAIAYEDRKKHNPAPADELYHRGIRPTRHHWHKG